MTYLHKTIDAVTGEEITKPYTKAELDEVKASEAAIAAKQAAAETKATEKAALLAKLGITDDEAKLLLS